MRTFAIRSVGSLLAVMVLSAVPLKAQTPTPAAPDFSKVEIKTTKISDNFYLLEGQGGQIGVLAGPDGILMVDSQFAPLSQKIAAAIRQISSAPIRFLIDTHVHGDHTGGNENFAKMGATVFSREELRDRLARPVAGANGVTPPVAPAAALPMVTYRGPVTFHMDGEEVEVIPIIRAHTDGDTMVRFRHADVLMMGDFFRTNGYPNIDRNNGGSLNGMLEGLGIAIGLTGPNTKVIPGHGVIVDRNRLTAHRDLILAVRDRVKKMVDDGKTLDEVLAAKVTADYDATTEQAQQTGPRFVGQVYAELKAAR